MAITLKKTNFAKGTLASDIAIDANSLSLQTGEGAKFPQTGNFRAVLWSASYAAPESDANREIVEATLTSGDTFSITRAQEGTTAKAWSANDNFALVFTKETLDEIETEINTKASLTGAETLTNKRITPRIYSTATTATLSPNVDNYDIFEITALAGNLTINDFSGTPTNGQKVIIRIRDNGTSRMLTWSTNMFVARATIPSNVTRPNTWSYFVFQYHSDTSNWEVIEGDGIKNTRIQPRVSSITSASSITPELFLYDTYKATALAENITINNPATSSIGDGEQMIVALKDNGTSRTISWGNKYASGDVTLPTATTAGKWLYIGLKYNSTADKWHCLAVGNNY